MALGVEDLPRKGDYGTAIGALGGRISARARAPVR
jgi:hypothetical protein